MNKKFPVVAFCTLTLAGCGAGGGGGFVTPFEIALSEVGVPFQDGAVNATYSSANATPNGPAVTTATFTAAGGITALNSAAADTANNTMTITLNVNGGLSTIALNIATAPAIATPAASAIAVDLFAATTADLQQVLAAVATGPANTSEVAFQGENAQGLMSSAYGLWAVSNGGGNYSIGSFAVGTETSAADMLTLHNNAANTAVQYNGSTIGFGTYTTSGGTANTPFVFDGTASITANFVADTVTTTMSGLTTLDVNDNNAGPTLSTLTNAVAGPIAGNKYTTTLTGTSTVGVTATPITGPLNGTFYGPLAAETAGVYTLSGGAVNLLGSFGAIK
jgi:C-lobe and N-lobe beta barrels of Tf-binding protein B